MLRRYAKRCPQFLLRPPIGVCALIPQVTHFSGHHRAVPSDLKELLTLPPKFE
jgi:hypothetical protein